MNNICDYDVEIQVDGYNIEPTIKQFKRFERRMYRMYPFCRVELVHNVVCQSFDIVCRIFLKGELKNYKLEIDYGFSCNGTYVGNMLDHMLDDIDRDIKVAMKENKDEF